MNMFCVCVVQIQLLGAVSRLPMEGSLNVTLEVLECDVFTVSPIKVCFASHLLMSLSKALVIG